MRTNAVQMRTLSLEGRQHGKTTCSTCMIRFMQVHVFHLSSLSQIANRLHLRLHYVDDCCHRSQTRSLLTSKGSATSGRFSSAPNSSAALSVIRYHRTLDLPVKRTGSDAAAAAAAKAHLYSAATMYRVRMEWMDVHQCRSETLPYAVESSSEDYVDRSMVDCWTPSRSLTVA